MSDAFFIASRSLTAQLIAKENCGPTCHDGSVTNLDWCIAECAAQNAKRKRDAFKVCRDSKGHVWVAIKDGVHIDWVKGAE